MRVAFLGPHLRITCPACGKPLHLTLPPMDCATHRHDEAGDCEPLVALGMTARRIHLQYGCEATCRH